MKNRDRTAGNMNSAQRSMNDVLMDVHKWSISPRGAKAVLERNLDIAI